MLSERKEKKTRENKIRDPIQARELKARNLFVIVRKNFPPRNFAVDFFSLDFFCRRPVGVGDDPELSQRDPCDIPESSLAPPQDILVIQY